MIKRINKITSLLVAAAAIVSVVPTTAVNAAAVRLGTKDGSIKVGYAFNGKYIYEGYKGDDNDRSIYYNASGSEKAVSDLDNVAFSSNTVAKYGDKYISVTESNDEYVVDLSTGKVIKEDDSVLPTSIEENAMLKLKNKLKSTDRYGLGVKFDDTNFQRVLGGQFGQVLYQYTTANAASTTPATATAYGLTNASGQYIDISNRINIKAYNASKQIVSLTEFAKTVNGVTVTLNSQPKVLGQDNDYVYLLSKVTFTGAINIQTGVDLTGEQTILQKVSKAQGDTKDEAYVPKTVESYIVSSGFGVDDAADAETAIGKINADSSNVRVVNGVIYVVSQSGSKVYVDQVELNSREKVKNVSDSVKYDQSLAVIGDGADENATAYSFDVNGNVWIVNDGKIMKSAKAGDFETVYTCDSAIDALDVYDEGNLIAWDNDGDRYTTVTEGKTQTVADGTAIQPATPVPTPVVKTGWDKQANGTWMLYNTAGTALTGWQKDKGVWYLLDASGIMKTGWQSVAGKWYFMDNSGAMKTGWFKDTKGTWYYADASGKMLSNTTVGGYKLGASGAWVK